MVNMNMGWVSNSGVYMVWVSMVSIMVGYQFWWAWIRDQGEHDV